MIKTLSSCAVAMLGLVIACTVHAGLRYTIETDILQGDKKVQKERFVDEITVDGEKARIDFLAQNGSKPKNGGFILTVDGGKTFALSDGGEAVCSDWSTDDFFSTVGKMLDKGTRFINADLEEAKFEKVLEEPGPEMHGYPTTHLRLLTSFAAKGKILFMRFEYGAEVTDEVWMTSGLKLPAHERKWLEATAKTGFDYIDKLVAAWNAEVSGTVLKQRSVVRLTNLDSKETSTKTEIIEVTRLEMLDSGQIPEGTFTMPRCKQVDKNEMEEEAKRFIKKSLK
ncbi:MAG: hypothetical protein WBN81_13480 [Gammaproteobacteria bacterium]